MEGQTAGRTRLGRFAAITVPATVAAGGLGLAMVQGMVGAAISSADGFSLQSKAITSDSLKVRPGQAEATTGADETVYAETGGTTNANGITVTAQVPLPVLGTAELHINSTDPTIGLGSVILNAKTLAMTDGENGADGGSSGAVLDGVALGVAQSEAGFAANPGTGYVADGFALTAGSSTLNNLDAQTYAIQLEGLEVEDLSLGVSLLPSN
ncbi:hypothetical protein ACFP6A_11505 [Quadrisphaera sp. GCM10027208]|uniref:hypothetical protein n=1 Tax=Quadrisphaera sp. GCM10027208 TaxID=3273423 RepID=UPI00360A472E